MQTSPLFALSFEATWGNRLVDKEVALENMRGPNPINRLAPINPEVGSPSGRLESDGGSATGNYHLTIPLIALPGRGIDLGVTANYNSQIWSKFNESGYAMFGYGVDGDWPVPGLNLGFGKLVFPDNGVFIHSNGSRQVLSSPGLEIVDGRFTGRVTAHFLDGSGGTVECPVWSNGCKNSPHVAYVSLDNGRKMEMLAASKNTNDDNYTYYPIKIVDANGNFIKIDYRTNSTGTPTPPNIERITDTVGRVVQFHYDANNLPIAITGPDKQVGSRVYARLYYRRINSSIRVPTVGSPQSTFLTLDFHALSAIYFPGNHTGFVFSDHTPYGIPKTVSVNRHMSASSDSLTAQGNVTNGTMTRRSHFDYPDTDQSFWIKKLPKYATRTDAWIDLVSGVERQAITHYDTRRLGEVRVTAPDGTSVLQGTVTDKNSWQYGLTNWILTVASNDKWLETTSFIWELGPDNIPRQKEVRIHNHELNAIKRVEFRYGRNSRELTDEIHYDYVNPDNINQAKKLTHKVNRYVNRPEYAARNFSLVSENSVFGGDIVNPGYAAWETRTAELRALLAQKKLISDPLERAIARAQRAVDAEADNEPEKTIERNGHEITNPAWTEWRARMERLMTELGQARANAGPALRETADAQATYDQAVRLQPPQTIENELERTSFQYDTAPLLPAHASSIGYAPITDSSVPRGLLSRVTRWLGSDSRTISESSSNLREIHTDYIHDETGNLRSVRNSPTSQVEYDYNGRTNFSLPSSIIEGAIDPNSSARNRVEVMYDLSLGLPVRVTDENRIVSEYTYKPGAFNWRPASIQRSSGTKTTYRYNDQFLSITTKMTDAEGRVYDQTSRYDGRGLVRDTRVHRRTDGGHDIIEYQYDDMGRKTKQSFPRRTIETKQNQWITYAFDHAGRLSTVTEPTGTISQRYYNETTVPQSVPPGAIGASVRVVGPWQRESWFMSDALGQLRYVVKSNPASGKVTDRGGQLAEYVHDARGLVTLSYFGSQMRTFQFDSLSRLTGVRVPERAATLDIRGTYSRSGGSFSDVYQYDDQSNLVSHVDPRGVRTTYTYANDPLNRIQSVSYDLSMAGDPSSGIWPAATTTFEYVTSGNRRRPLNITTEGVLQQSFGYDINGLPSKVTSTFAAAPQSPVEMSMRTDSLGRPTVFTYPERYENGVKQGVNTLEYLYSKDGELARLKLDGGILVDNVRYASSGITHVDLFHRGAKLVEDYSYDSQTHRLTKQSLIPASSPQQKLLDLQYDYTNPQTPGQTGQITKQTNLLADAVQRSHGYDAWGRLTSSELKSGTNLMTRQNYGYDLYDNRVTVQAQQWDPASAVWIDLPSANADGLNTPANLSNRIQGSEYSYDDAGNLIRSPGPGGRMQRYVYDAAGRLAWVEDDNRTLIEAYQYGSDRQRVGVSTDRRNWRVTVWNGNTEMARYDVHGGTAALNWVDRPIYLGNRLLAELQHGQTGTTLKMFHADQRDSVVTTELVAGGIQAKPQSVLGYGTDKTPSTQADDERRFTSYRRSDRTGLDYAINRYYDARLGRFTQPDPLSTGAFNFRDPQTLNAYAYVSNDPVNFRDPLGLKRDDLPKCTPTTPFGTPCLDADVVVPLGPISPPPPIPGVDTWFSRATTISTKVRGLAKKAKCTIGAAVTDYVFPTPILPTPAIGASYGTSGGACIVGCIYSYSLSVGRHQSTRTRKESLFVSGHINFLVGSLPFKAPDDNGGVAGFYPSFGISSPNSIGGGYQFFASEAESQEDFSGQASNIDLSSGIVSNSVSINDAGQMTVAGGVSPSTSSAKLGFSSPASVLVYRNTTLMMNNPLTEGCD